MKEAANLRKSNRQSRTHSGTCTVLFSGQCRERRLLRAPCFSNISRENCRRNCSLYRDGACKRPVGRAGVFPDALPDATPMIPSEKMLKEEPSKASKKKDKPARKLQRPQTVELPKKPPISESPETVRPQGAEAQSAPSQPAPLRLRTLWPEAPAPGTFSR
jgi:hypothetical protein